MTRRPPPTPQRAELRKAFERTIIELVSFLSDPHADATALAKRHAAAKACIETATRLLILLGDDAGPALIDATASIIAAREALGPSPATEEPTDDGDTEG